MERGEGAARHHSSPMTQAPRARKGVWRVAGEGSCSSRAEDVGGFGRGADRTGVSSGTPTVRVLARLDQAAHDPDTECSGETFDIEAASATLFIILNKY